MGYGEDVDLVTALSQCLGGPSDARIESIQGVCEYGSSHVTLLPHKLSTASSGRAVTGLLPIALRNRFRSSRASSEDGRHGTQKDGKVKNQALADDVFDV